MGEANQANWVGIRPIDPEEEIPVKQDTAANLKATVTQASIARTVTGTVTATTDRETPAGSSQINYDGEANNSLVTIYTVTSGKTLYISTLAFNMVCQTSGAWTGYLVITDDSDVAQYYYFYFSYAIEGQYGVGLPFPTHQGIPAGWKVKVYSSNANLWCHGFVFGYER